MKTRINSSRLLAPALALCIVEASLRAQCPIQFHLSAPEGAVNSWFGQAVAIDGNTLIVGAPFDDVGANSNQGSAHIYRWNGSAWIFEAILTASDGAADDRFGTSVAISGDTALVGAHFDDVGANSNQGSAYVFTRSGMVWTQQAQLTASDAAAGHQFGISVALDGGTALIGASRPNIISNGGQGSAYIYTRSGVVWTEQAKLTASDDAASNFFGFSVALSGDTALVGAHYERAPNIGNQGAAYVFARSGTPAVPVWTQQAKLTPIHGSAGDAFGFSVALSGNTALVGTFGDDVVANANQGSAYVYTRSGTVWTQQAQLNASDGAQYDDFGWSVALDGDSALVGASTDDLGGKNAQGSAYVFTRTGTTWTQQARLTDIDGAAYDYFGRSVALSGESALVGAYLDDVGANPNHGSAHIFHRANGLWRAHADANGDSHVDMEDLMSVLMNFGAMGPPGTGPGDADGNGIVDFNDILTVLANFGAVCP